MNCSSCKSNNTELRRLMTSNGIWQYRYQCLDCGGQASPNLKHSDAKNRVGNLETVPEYDKTLWREIWESGRKDLVEITRKQKQEAQKEWWSEYSKYLNSQKWLDKRRRVFERDNYTCQACLKRPAEHCHHLTYDRVFNEPLFDLISVCTQCHIELHPHMQEAVSHEI